VYAVFLYATVYGVLYVAAYGVLYVAVYGVVEGTAVSQHQRSAAMKELETLIQEFEIACRAAGLNNRTIAWYQSKLFEFHHFIGDDDWTDYRTVRKFFADLQSENRRYKNHPGLDAQGKLSVETIRGYGRALKRFFNWLVEEDYLDASPMRHIRLPRRPKHVPKDVSLQDIQSLLQVAITSRDKAIILFLCTTGVRASELCTLTIDRVDIDKQVALVRGKRDKERFVFFDQRTSDAIQVRLEERPETTEPYLFTTYRGKKLKVSGLRQILRRLVERAEISNPVSAHRFRHAFAKRWMMNGGDEFSLATILGHEDIATTRIYSQYRLGELREKYAKIIGGFQM